MNGVAIGLAVVAATFYGLSSALQHRAARMEEPHQTLDPHLLWRLLHRRLWLGGVAIDVTGDFIHFAALAFGPLALVQPILVSGLFLAIPVEAALDRRRPDRRDLTAVGMSAFGLAAFVAISQPGAGQDEPTLRAWIVVSVSVGIAVAALLALAQRSTGARSATFLGIATGVLFAFVAALAKACVATFGGDPLELLTDWRIYALIVVGIAAVELNQNAFQAGRLAAPLTAIGLTDPVVSLIIAVGAFKETLEVGGIRLPLEILAAVFMARGIWLTSNVRAAEATPGGRAT